MSVSEQLARLALHTTSEGIPASARHAAARMLLDTVGCALIGANAPGVREVLELERELGGAEQATVLCHGDRLPIPSAVFVNSAIIHALDFDDNYPAADLHIMSIVLPNALAAGEFTGAACRDVLTATILGVEVAGRIGKAYMRARKAHRYVLTSSLVGGFGGVAAACRLLGLSIRQTVHAFGAFYAHTGGNRQALLERKLTKRLQPAISARAAAYSALLARHGVTGPEGVFDGEANLFRVHTQEEGPIEVAVGLPESTWGVEDLWVKRFPTCGVHHVATGAALRLHRRHAPPPEEIERVDVYLDEIGGYLVGMPFEPGDVPQIDAQFCAPYAIALALVHGDVSVARFADEAVRTDVQADRLARRIHVAANWRAFAAGADEPRPAGGGQAIRVRLRDGRVIEQACTRDDVRSPAPADDAEVEEKFRECVRASGSLPTARVDAAIQAVWRFEEYDTVAAWLDSLFPSRDRP